jgi:N-acetylmuramic acid 6-phosphate etherase
MISVVTGPEVVTGSTRLKAVKLKNAGGVLAQALYEMQLEKSESALQITASTDSIRPRKLAVCIDGGGTKCAVAVADEDGNIGRGEAGACNL